MKPKLAEGHLALLRKLVANGGKLPRSGLSPAENRNGTLLSRKRLTRWEHLPDVVLYITDAGREALED